MSRGQKRILIVNRGEIAIRIAKAIRELGHVAVGVWTDNEKHAVHLEYCHEWLQLEGKSHGETFLNIPKIIALAKKHSIDAIHPGYGFLAESCAFAEALKKAGIIFIGPNTEAIKLMGDKGASKSKALAAGVPVVPGPEGEIEDLERAQKEAAKMGFPVLLKAVAGGGGKGMRICHEMSELEKNFTAVKREAESAFGYGGLLLEKFIINPRHIEVQVLGDKKGNIYHFFERECSVQRRHQKILEEAPSPFIGEDEDLRNRLCDTAIALAKAVKYDSAGTVEFIMGENREFYFLEMNTRIQVEHPITEEIVGIDLLVCMIQAALDQDLGIPSQDWIRRSGVAVECRVCAEDPITMLPAPGYVSGFETLFPQGVRFDHCLYKGLRVTSDFDPMVGKIITKGITRDVAIRKMRAALDGLLIEGLKTNIPLLKEILKDEEFLAGNYSTHFLNDRKPQDRIETELSLETFYKKLAVMEAAKLGL